MKSMTGFGYAEIQNDTIHLTADLKSYNNRYLDLIINIPPPLNPLEPAIRERLTRSVKKGACRTVSAHEGAGRESEHSPG